jgi:ferredoxin
MLKRINKLLESEYFPVSFRVLTLISFLTLVYIGFSGSSMSTNFLRQLSRTNLTTSFVWRFWWPFIILSAILMGRVWCMVCPVEMITTFFARIGRKRPRPKWLTSGWIITILYGIIVIGGITIIEIDRVPVYTAIYLLSIIGISIVAGLIFEKNTFCRYICPVGYLLGIFSKMAFWGWRVKDKEACKKCTDKSCIKADYIYNFSSKSCGTGLFPARISNNDHCILCGGCMKSCKANSDGKSSRPNPALVKTGFGSGLLKSGPLLFAEWVFLYLLSAHLIDEISEYRLISDLSASIGHGSFLNYSGLNQGLLKNTVASAYLFLFLPVLLWFIPYVVMISARIKITISDYLKNFSLAFLPVIAGLFAGLIIMEIVTRLPYYKYIIHDPRGVDTIRSILTRQIIIPPFPDWLEWCLLLSMIIMSVAGILISLKVIRKLKIRLKIQENKHLILRMLPVVFVIIFFAEVILYRAF